tara:strand:- start:1073 stop:3127 length:2055 start_codon:yes stop_codon:yes gene_type:complete
MAKVKRKKIPRGVELTPGHVFDPITDMKDEINSSDVDISQRKKKYGTFRLNFNIPWLDNKYFFDNRTLGYEADGTPDPNKDELDQPFYIPFCLPPLQDHFDPSDPRTTDGVPSPVLTSVGLSFDQSDEPAAILSQWYGKAASPDDPSTGFTGYQYSYWPGNATEYPADNQSPRTYMPPPRLGLKTYNRTDAYELEISILEKEQMFFKKGAMESGSEPQFMRPTNEIASIAFPSSNYIPRDNRRNPLTYDGLNKVIDPYKTYILALKAPNLHDTEITRREHCALVNVWITLKFKMELVSRDVGASGDVDVVAVQNIPLHYGAKGSPGVTVTAPSSGEKIKADDSKGVVSSDGLEAIDQEVRNKIRGGYGDFSMSYQAEASKEDAAYEVITVPVGQGFAHNRMGVRDEYPFAPYVRGPYYDGAMSAGVTSFPMGPYVDRRIIPISHPMTIHHVIFAMNYTSDRQAIATDALGSNEAGRTLWQNFEEPNNTIAYKVGLGMVSGVRADGFGYQQIAYASWTNMNSLALADGQIDSTSLGLPARVTTDMQSEYKLWSVPLVLKTGNNGVGYYSAYSAAGKGINGKPFFVGESNSYTHARTKVGEIGGGAGHYAFSGGSQGPANGTEQYLEVRFSVDPTNGGANNPYAYNSGATEGQRIEWQGPTGVTEKDLAIGYGGCWMYIIGKKHVT